MAQACAWTGPERLAGARIELATTVTREFSFDAAHQLSWHPGKCARLHGHTYRVRLSVTGDLDANGVVVDFATLKSDFIEVVMNDYDHQFLNDFLDNPTAERIAADIFGRLTCAGYVLSEVTVYETATCSATVRPAPTRSTRSVPPAPPSVSGSSGSFRSVGPIPLDESSSSGSSDAAAGDVRPAPRSASGPGGSG